GLEFRRRWLWIRRVSAFTRVHSPYLKGVYARLRGLWTGVNALNDALCAGMSGREASAPTRLDLGDAPLHGGCAGCVLKIQLQGVLRFDRRARHDRAMLQPILILLHQETSTPRRMRHALRQRGY